VTLSLKTTLLRLNERSTGPVGCRQCGKLTHTFMPMLRKTGFVSMQMHNCLNYFGLELGIVSLSFCVALSLTLTLQVFHVRDNHTHLEDIIQH
jgi:hypothetical protein